jgi:hypothetical protein
MRKRTVTAVYRFVAPTMRLIVVKATGASPS